MRDLEVLEYLFDSMGLACDRLGKAVEKKNYNEAKKIKKLILELNSKIKEELM